MEELSLAAQAEELPEAGSLQQIPERVEQRGLGTEQILELSLQPAAEHTAFKG